MRKSSAVVLSLTIAAAALSACGDNNNRPSASSQTPSGSSPAASSQAPSDSSPAASEKKSDPVSLTVVHNQGEYAWPAYQKIVDGFNAATGNKAELKYIPAQESESWLQAQFVAASEPEVISGTSQLANAYKNGWIVDMLPLLDQVSPYTNKPWKESFLPGLIESAIDSSDASNPHLYGIPNQVVTVNLYYNKDIFDKIGVAQPPATITEFLEVAKKAKDAGYIPFSIQNSIDWNIGWFAGDLFGYLWKSRQTELDLNQSGKVESNEWAIAVMEDKVTADSPELKEYLRFIGDLVPYLNDGFNSASWEFEGLFNDGKSAMTLNGSWYPNQHQQGGFPVNYGIAPIPYLDKTYSQFGGDTRYKYKIGSTPSFAISRNAQKRDAEAASLDFLQYMTAPDGGAKVLAEDLNLIPVVSGVEVPQVLEPIMASFGTDDKLDFLANEFTPEQKDKWFKNLQEYMAGRMKADKFLADYGKDLKKYAKEAIKNHPEWKADAYLK